MYTHIFFVTSVRGITFPPQIAASAGESVFGAKMPTPFFFIAATFFLAAAFVAFVIVVFVVVTALVVIAIERLKVHASLEP